jgi:hypothetical protein
MLRSQLPEVVTDPLATKALAFLLVERGVVLLHLGGFGRMAAFVVPVVVDAPSVIVATLATVAVVLAETMLGSRPWMDAKQDG